MGFIESDMYPEWCEELDDGTAEIRRSLPRPLMPLFEFLYSDAKYCQSSLSSLETQSSG